MENNHNSHCKMVTKMISVTVAVMGMMMEITKLRTKLILLRSKRKTKRESNLTRERNKEKK